MPGSFLARHRTICAVLEEMRQELEKPNDDWETHERVIKLIDEAKGYAQSMSAKLMEYKLATGPVDPPA
jgi:hypothetical protein